MIWWLSFADPAKTKGDQFLGVVIVDANSFEDAIKTAWRLEINPGGECMGLELPEEARAEHASYMNRLIGINEVTKIGERASDIKDEQLATRVTDAGSIACGHCNHPKDNET